MQEEERAQTVNGSEKTILSVLWNKTEQFLLYSVRKNTEMIQYWLDLAKEDLAVDSWEGSSY